jgi:hypothetical protein
MAATTAGWVRRVAAVASAFLGSFMMAQPFANTKLPAPQPVCRDNAAVFYEAETDARVIPLRNPRASLMEEGVHEYSQDDRLAPAAITVIAAAAEQKHNHKDDQQEFHNFLQNLKFKNVELDVGFE